MSKINNPKIKLEYGLNMNDKDYSTELLTIVKSMEKNTCVFLTECSNEVLFKKIENIFNKYKDLQRDIYENMFRKGLYTMEAVEEKNITSKLSSIYKSDKVLVLNNYKIEKETSFDELIKDTKYLEKLEFSIPFEIELSSKLASCNAIDNISLNI